jgi:hypothetical protein
MAVSGRCSKLSRLSTVQEKPQQLSALGKKRQQLDNHRGRRIYWGIPPMKEQSPE